MTRSRDASRLVTDGLPGVNTALYMACDGVTNDRAALATLIANEQHIILSGSVLVNGDPLELRSGQTITSYGGELLCTAGGANSIMLLIDGKDDVTIDGLRARLTAGNRDCIYVRNSKRVSVLDPHIGSRSNLWTGGAGIFFAKNCQDVEVIGGFINGTLVGIATGGDPRFGTSTDDGTVIGVTIDGTNIYGCLSEAIDINWDTAKGVISNVIARNIGTRGDANNQMLDIGGSVDGTGTICRDILVDNCIFEAANTSGNGVGQQNGNSGCEIKQWSRNVWVRNSQIIGAGQANTFGVKHSNTTDCGFEGINSSGMADGGQILGVSVRPTVRRSRFAGITHAGFYTADGGTFTDVDATDLDITGTAATDNAVMLRDCVGADVSGLTVRGGFTSAVSGLGRGLRADSDCTAVRAEGVDVTGCNVGVTISSPKSILSGKLSSCVTYGLDASAADLTLGDLQAIDNVTGAGGQYQVRFQAGSDRLRLVGTLTVDDTRGSPLARGVQFLGGDVVTVSVPINVVRFLTTALSFVSVTNFSGNLGSRPVTVANLPATALTGSRAVVSDANATTFGTTVAAGGANSVPVIRSAGAWVIG